MRILTSLLSAALVTLAGVAQAQENFQGLETIGKPEPKGMGFQFPATELMRDLVWLDNFLLVIITVISVFVTCLLAYAAFKFHRSRNDTPGTFTHHSVLEVAWTVVPVGILVVIGAFSLPILFKQQEIPEADITIKVTGYQWYWGYEYVDHDFGFDSVMLQKDELADYGYAPDEYLLATDTAVVVPVGATVVMQLTGADVIHSWTIPAFGVKQDAVPGRLAELWFAAEKEGVYFGQCSELCGQAHAYMPITVKVVSQEQYDAWLSSTIEELAGVPQSVQVASN
ncbi:cytochrome c oxidase subunit II [Planktomarina temperata]|jgi:cytochrome c oxidase subunit 2|uniref:Cytochrome c oxidase subunit 2 n=2 Tax=Planktomarina TaxID=1284657 RepID=A0AAN0VIX7_9RHOB|nr:cytochrome c oxidase subunit 2 precursor [Planktomarina temperata RCA23]MDA8751585.1 cytochrome c oxidase subunit II [Planktomarina temperata]MDB3873845.1 cytochrome c oxidase subunit II [bacterium]MDA8861001.1 cytochrome c oxidase subunit II [Planktomarina temperata]MDA9046405.1 cytochrome c oxidase subunit II [Planktomarina temperata]